jgi:hypothetical protein
MLNELFPRAHRHYSSLPVLGAIADDFTDWFTHLKNSEARIMGVSKGTRVKSTHIGHHSGSSLNPFPFMRRNHYEPKDHTHFPCTTHVFGP